MKCSAHILIKLFLFLSFVGSAEAQLHDFDSLISHNKAFKETAKIIGDTLDIFNDYKILNITLESDFKNLIKRKYKDEYQEAVWKIMFNDTKSFAPVPFNHDTHKSAGIGCGDCHDSLFKKKTGSTDVGNVLNMKALRKGKYCGSCHDGKKAFSASKKCKQCHQK